MTQNTAAPMRLELVLRVGVFLENLIRNERQLDAWECEHIQRALGHLKAGNFAESERAMSWAEVKPPDRTSHMVVNLLMTHAPQTAAELLTRLEEIVKEGA
jgi:hypothetical protein